ncbi:MAG: hypothetical protein IIB38_03940, partial [Candidatus Hydrogenedentes bacterium]|nr:hypothetical protein [Candidatus Hydrogenedentota bacterium]
MQTVLTMAERLDMSAEEAVEKLKYMFFDVKGIGSDISDEQCDLLIDIDDDPALADEIRAKKLAEIEKVKAAAAKKKAAAEKKKAAGEKKKAAVKKKVVAKKKTAVKKAPAKKKAVKKKAPKKKAATEVGDGEAVEKVLAKKPVKKGPIAEILPSDEEMAAQKAGADDALKIVVGSAIEHESGTPEIVRADGTHVGVQEVDLEDLGAKEIKDDSRDESTLGLLAQAELQQKEDNRRKATQRLVTAPDPRVVEEVIRKD